MAKPNQDLRKQLWQGLRTGDTELVRQALADGADPNCGYGDWRPLGKALRHDMPEIALLLVEAGADLAYREYERSMMTLAVVSAKYLEALRAMLARAPGDFEALEAAARAGNHKAVELLLEAGVQAIPTPSADKEAPRRWPEPVPVLAHWPWKREAPPAALVDATYGHPLSDQVAQQLGLSFAHARNLPALQQFAQRASVSPRARQQVLYQALQACWVEGSQWLIENRYAVGGKSAGPGIGILAAMSTWLNDQKRRASGWETLAQLVAQGHHPDLRFFGPGEDDEAGDPQGVVLLGRTSSPVRRNLLKHLLDLGMSASFPAAGGATTLAHVLIALGEFDLLPMLGKHFPEMIWETPDTPSLIHTWIAHHGLVRGGIDTPEGQAMLHGLSRCESLCGVDWSRSDGGNHSLLRELLEVNQAGWLFYENKNTELLETLALRFIERGVDALKPDEDGVSDIQYAQQTDMASAIVARLQTAAMERRTAGVAMPRRGPRL